MMKSSDLGLTLVQSLTHSVLHSLSSIVCVWQLFGLPKVSSRVSFSPVSVNSNKATEETRLQHPERVVQQSFHSEGDESQPLASLTGTEVAESCHS